MKYSYIFIAVASLGLIAGCGGNKKKVETPTVDTSANTNSTGTTTTTDDDTTTDDSERPQIELENAIYFPFDKSELTAEARETLNHNATWLKEDDNRQLTIEGHTDEQGTNEYNLGLGERRARAAKAYLVRLGIDESRIRILTYGEERLASDQDDKNRRSVFVGTK